jgi:hypothetical protein
MEISNIRECNKSCDKPRSEIDGGGIHGLSEKIFLLFENIIGVIHYLIHANP